MFQKISIPTKESFWLEHPTPLEIPVQLNTFSLQIFPFESPNLSEFQPTFLPSHYYLKQRKPLILHFHFINETEMFLPSFP